MPLNGGAGFWTRALGVYAANAIVRGRVRDGGEVKRGGEARGQSARKNAVAGVSQLQACACAGTNVGEVCRRDVGQIDR